MCNKFSGTARPRKATSGNIGFIQININWGNSSLPACPLQSVLSMCFGQKRIWHLVRVGALKSPLSSSLVSLTFPSPAHNVSHNTPSALLPNGFPLTKKMYYMSIQTCKQLLHGNILRWEEAPHLAKIWCSTHYAHISWAPLICVCPLRRAACGLLLLAAPLPAWHFGLLGVRTLVQELRFCLPSCPASSRPRLLGQLKPQGDYPFFSFSSLKICV